MINIGIFSNSHKVRSLTAGCIFLVTAYPDAAHSAFEKNGCGSRAISLANSYVAIADDPWAVFYNPAGLARISSIRVAAFFSPGQFGMNELRTVCAGATLPLSFCTGDVVIHQFGYELYKETGVSVAFGWSISEWLSLGTTIHFNRIAIEGYGNASPIAFDVGGIALITDEVHVGWCWKNVANATIGAQSEPLPQSLSMGVCYEITERSRLTVELEKDIHYPIVKKFGYEQQVFDLLFARLGISDNPDKFSCGLGVKVGGVEFSYAGYSHAQLGWSHQIELSIALQP
jgi:hypothetical protein